MRLVEIEQDDTGFWLRTKGFGLMAVLEGHFCVKASR
jgi:hypothetical protein